MKENEMKSKSYPVGSEQTQDGHKGKVLRKKCWQCRKTSVIEYTTKFGVSESCLNNCGPEALGRMFQF